MKYNYEDNSIINVYKNDREYVLHSWSVQNELTPLVVNNAEGVYFQDSNGKKYIDMASQLINLNVGHKHPKVVQAIKEQTENVCYIAPAFANEKRSTLAKMISEITPDNIKKSFFTNGGADANENAVKIARLETGKWKIISRYRSYHGATYGAIALTGDPRRPVVEPAMPGVVRILDPYCYRCSFGKEYGSCNMECVKHIEEVILYENPSKIAAVIVEPITGTNGIIIPPEDYLKKVREICNKYGILMIADEVMSGFGRTGEWFGVDVFGVKPDIMTMAKGITSGYVPLGAVAVSEEIAEKISDKYLYCGLTYSGHPLACAAAIANIEVYKEENLIDNSKKMGILMNKLLLELKKNHACVGDVRNRGLFGCIELVKDKGTKEPVVPWNSSGKVMNEIKKALTQEGVYMYLRWNFMFIAPPLIINEKQMRDAFEIIDKSLVIGDKYIED